MGPDELLCDSRPIGILRHRYYDPDVEKVVPKDAIVLDLGEINPRRVIGHLRTCTDCRGAADATWCGVIADQIEAVQS